MTYQDRIIDEAADWFVRLQDAPVAEETRQAFGRWLAASAEHVREYLLLTAVQDDLGQINTTSTDELIEGAQRSALGNVVRMDARPKAMATDGETVKTAISSAFRMSRLSVGLAAGIALLVAATLWWVMASQPNTALYRTSIGEQKSFPLPDGSIVTLNAVSQVRLAFTDRTRDIELISGEVLFDVAKSPARPFRVLTGDSVIQAIGTRFNVYYRRDTTTVTVVEGTVEIQKPTEKVRVTMGQRARVPEGPRAVMVAEVDPQADLTWQTRQLVFESRPLSEVVAEFNLYNAMPIEIGDPKLNAVEVSGAFYANDPTSFVSFLEEARLAHAERTSKKVLLKK